MIFLCKLDFCTNITNMLYKCNTYIFIIRVKPVYKEHRRAWITYITILNTRATQDGIVNKHFDLAPTISFFQSLAFLLWVVSWIKLKRIQFNINDANIGLWIILLVDRMKIEDSSQNIDKIFIHWDSCLSPSMVCLWERKWMPHCFIAEKWMGKFDNSDILFIVSNTNKMGVST